MNAKFRATLPRSKKNGYGYVLNMAVTDYIGIQKANRSYAARPASTMSLGITGQAKKCKKITASYQSHKGEWWGAYKVKSTQSAAVSEIPPQTGIQCL